MIACEKQINGIATYPWSFIFTNNSPFLTPATAIDISSSQATSVTPSTFPFAPPVPPNGQATVSGTFTVANPVPGSTVCLDIQLKAGEKGWCCPMERVCYVLPKCPGCVKVQAVFQCLQGQHALGLTITNEGPTAASSITVISNTPGVTVSPQTITQAFPQNTPVQVPLNVTGAAPGQAISLTVSLNGPYDPKTGVNDWCCSSTVTATYPKTFCSIVVRGWLFNDVDLDGVRDSDEEGVPGLVVTLTGLNGTPRRTTSDASGIYRFEEVELGTYRLVVQPGGGGLRVTSPEGGVHTVTVAGPSERTFDFGLGRPRP